MAGAEGEGTEGSVRGGRDVRAGGEGGDGRGRGTTSPDLSVRPTTFSIPTPTSPSTPSTRPTIEGGSGETSAGGRPLNFGLDFARLALARVVRWCCCAGTGVAGPAPGVVTWVEVVVEAGSGAEGRREEEGGGRREREAERRSRSRMRRRLEAMFASRSAS